MTDDLEWIISLILVVGIGSFWAWVWLAKLANLLPSGDVFALLGVTFVFAATVASLIALALAVNFMRQK